MFYPHSRSFRQFNSIAHSFVQGEGLPLRDVLAEGVIDRIAAEEGVCFGSTLTTALVLWAFVTQAISKDQTCLAAVARIITVLVGSGREACSSHTGGYCKARQKLPEKFLRRLTIEVGQGVEDRAADSWRWHGRRVLLVDGSTTTGPDTPANQKVYPQPPCQRPGLGFPVIRLVVLLGLATATLIDAAMGPYSGKESGESALLRTLFASLRDADVVVADRYYCSYWMLAMLQQRVVDGVFRMHHCRKYDFRRGRRLGPDHHLVTWTKPKRPDWMDEATYTALPDSLTLREMRTPVSQPGFRVKELVVVTSLTDPERYPSAEVFDLYHDRWHVEVDLRAIKQSLQMDELRCQTPSMLRKELWAHLLAYNLTRKVMAQAALTADLNPRRISFMATVQTLNEFRRDLLAATPEQLDRLAAIVFRTIAAHRVGDRPDRCEPRAIKRRPKPHDLLMVPRAEARAQLYRGRKFANH